MPGLTTIFIAGLSAVIVVPLLAFTSLIGGQPSCTPSASPATSASGGPGVTPPPVIVTAQTDDDAPPTAAPAPTDGWDSEQLANATTIITVGENLNVPPWGWVIAIATALQESDLHNLDHGDAAGPDSRGLFQQRATWGSLTERLNPATAARRFYTGGHAGQAGLLDIPNWVQLPLAEAANAVQHSAHPDAYADRQQDAVRLVTLVAAPENGAPADALPATDVPDCQLSDGDGLPTTVERRLPPNFAIPPGTPTAVTRAIGWALAQLGTPYSYGGDCTAARSGNPALECDCSSLVQMAYHAGGISLPRTTREQVLAGHEVQGIGQLRSGDLLFIPGSDGTPSNPRHVGIYIGDGLLIHAPKTGDVVKVATLNSWAAMIVDVRRITS